VNSSNPCHDSWDQKNLIESKPKKHRFKKNQRKKTCEEENSIAMNSVL